MAEKKDEPLSIVVALSHDADPYSALQDALAATDIPADSYRLVRSMGKQDLEDKIADADVAIVWHFAPELLRRAKNLKWVHFAMAGVDDALHPALVESPVLVTSSVGVHAAPVAEHAFAMILAFARGLVHAFANQFQRRWARREVVYSIQELQDLTLGVVGLGHIGRAVASLGKAFGMHVAGVSRHGAAVDDVDEVFTPDGLPKVLSRADYLVLCVPLTAETRGMMGVDEFRLMKESAILINAAGGSPAPAWTSSRRNRWRPTTRCTTWTTSSSRPTSPASRPTTGSGWRSYSWRTSNASSPAKSSRRRWTRSADTNGRNGGRGGIYQKNVRRAWNPGGFVGRRRGGRSLAAGVGAHPRGGHSTGAQYRPRQGPRGAG
jgi:phosphoglycerate dehydrogenase-like enzyme